MMECVAVPPPGRREGRVAVLSCSGRRARKGAARGGRAAVCRAPACPPSGRRRRPPSASGGPHPGPTRASRGRPRVGGGVGHPAGRPPRPGCSTGPETAGKGCRTWGYGPAWWSGRRPPGAMSASFRKKMLRYFRREIFRFCRSRENRDQRPFAGRTGQPAGRFAGAGRLPPRWPVAAAAVGGRPPAECRRNAGNRLREGKGWPRYYPAGPRRGRPSIFFRGRPCGVSTYPARMRAEFTRISSRRCTAPVGCGRPRWGGAAPGRRISGDRLCWRGAEFHADGAPGAG
ncbi:hypothetical protein UG55_100935 [Frankia sp. EI5c]|nr:hypothetical protein UG55_100935 [Frankia sp. EI5c]